MEKAILVGLDTGLDKNFNNSIEELKNLATACNIEVLDVLTQKAEAPTANYYIGKGKVEELKQNIQTHDANVVIFDDELSPSHIRNLEKALDIKVIDRTILILDIFARRAKTKEAMLQVELAQSMYLLPRVIGMYQSLSRQKSGTGSKGPGEQQLELDRRILRNNISKLKHELKDIVSVRRTQREKRKKSNARIVSLMGYTNSGKSTLMNSMLTYSINNPEKYVFEKDMLFATLETQTRSITLKNNHSFLTTDTVGFISKLPHHLIEAFKSTLEEISESSLILHVVDFSNPYYEDQIKVVNQVLADMDIKDIPILYVFNKIDKCSDLPIVNYSPAVYISALNQTYLDRLLQTVDQMIYPDIHHVKMLIPYEEGKIFNFLKENANVFSNEYTNEGIEVDLELNDVLYHKYEAYIKH